MLPADPPPRWTAWAGILGPTAFVAAWSTLGALRSGYSPVHDPISRLAAVGESTQPAMTAGFLAFAVGVGIFAPVLRTRASVGAARAAMLTAVSAVGIAALPLGGPGGDRPHAVAAAVAYAALAAVPLLAGRASLQRGDRRAAAGSIATGMAVATALVASMVASDRIGLAQRVGLTLGDLWIVGTAVTVLRSGTAPHPVGVQDPPHRRDGAAQPAGSAPG